MAKSRAQQAAIAISKKKLAKAKNGKVVKTSVSDPEGNVVKTKTNKRTGMTKTVVKYADPKSAGMRREVTRTFDPSQVEVYKKNPNMMTEDFAPAGTMKKGGNWIKGAIKKPGALRESLGVKKGKKIPKSTLEAAAKKGGKLGMRARLAITLGKLRKKG
jgi:hypothetical protein